MEDIDTIVVGAGVVGLACARALARAGREVLVIEALSGIGQGISARHSEVLHGGMYYPPGSLKAQLCVRGRALLYGYCATRGVAHRRCGKLIVATEAAECAELEALLQRGQANGVEGLRLLDRAQAQALEPALRAEAALLSPGTGIVDSHGLMLALQGDAEAAGAQCAFNTRVVAIEVRSDGLHVHTGTTEGDPLTLRARRLVNSAGLDAPALAAATAGFDAAQVPTARYAKGHYFALGARAPFSRLIYPVPEPGGLGVHLTLDLAGQARFGPDVEWIDTPHYTVDPQRAEAFEAAIRRYWPALPAGALQPAYAGVRPKIHGPGGHADFRIDGPREHGTPGLVQLFGIESPGLTASMAIADRVVQLLAND